jgi:hypothetical protein
VRTLGRERLEESTKGCTGAPKLHREARSRADKQRQVRRKPAWNKGNHVRARSSNWIEQGTPKPKVASSILAGRTSKILTARTSRGEFAPGCRLVIVAEGRANVGVPCAGAGSRVWGGASAAQALNLRYYLGKKICRSPAVSEVTDANKRPFPDRPGTLGLHLSRAHLLCAAVGATVASGRRVAVERYSDDPSLHYRVWNQPPEII